MKLSLIEDLNPNFLVLISTINDQQVPILHLCKQDFNELMSIHLHPTIVTAIRIAADLKTANDNNWQSAANFLNTIEDAESFASSLGYNIYDWI